MNKPSHVPNWIKCFAFKTFKISSTALGGAYSQTCVNMGLTISLSEFCSLMYLIMLFWIQCGLIIFIQLLDHNIHVKHNH